MKSKITEIFRSTQGEGKYLGVSQIFIRFFGCNIDCQWCDTKIALEKSDEVRDYSAKDLADIVLKQSKEIHSVSLTGGEPLIQKDFLKEFLPILKENKILTYLETNGILFSALEENIENIDFVSMDFKLPSSTGEKEFWQEHEAFLKISQKKDVFIKSVISLGTTEEDVRTAVKLASEVNRDIVFILQPNAKEDMDQCVKRCQRFQDIGFEFLNDVRIIPQMHKVLGVR